MATFQAQIEALAGTTGSQGLQWINDGVIDTINRIAIINPNLLFNFSEETVYATGGLDISAHHAPFSVRRGERPARQINPNESFDALDSESLNRATLKHPVYWLLNHKLYIAPTPGSGSEQGYANIVRYPTVNALSDTAYTTASSTFAKQFYRLPILFACKRILQEKMVNCVIPAFEAPVMGNLDFATLGTFIETDEDPELATSQTNKIQTQISKYSSETNKALGKYQADVQKVVQDYNLFSQKFNTISKEYEQGFIPYQKQEPKEEVDAKN